MKTAIAISLIALLSTPTAFAGMLDDYNQNIQRYSRNYGYGSAPSRVTTFGSDDFSTTTGSIVGSDVHLNTFGWDDFSTTTGTVGGRSVNCNTFGSGSLRTTTCR